LALFSVTEILWKWHTCSVAELSEKPFQMQAVSQLKARSHSSEVSNKAGQKCAECALLLEEELDHRGTRRYTMASLDSVHWQKYQ